MNRGGVDESAAVSGLRPADLSGRRWLSIALWRVPQLLLIFGLFWPEGIGPLWSLGFAWIGGSCTANAVRCGRVHCSIMGPLLIVLGLASLANTVGMISVSWTIIGAAALAIVAMAFVPEFLGRKYFGSQSRCDVG